MSLLVLSIGMFALLCLNKSASFTRRHAMKFASGAAFLAFNAITAFAQPEHRAGGEANLKLPDLSQVNFLGNINGRTLLMVGIGVSLLGMVFGLLIYAQLKKMVAKPIESRRYAIHT